MRKAIVIPARKGSTRLKDKLLLPVNGKPVIAWTVENCLKTGIPVIVACDSQEFVEILKDYPIEIILTPSDLKSGSDRIAYAVKDKDLDYIVNVQGDEPLIEPRDIVKLFDLLKDSPVATLYYPIEKEDDYLNPNIVKVISDKDDFAIYFSRSPIPFYRDLDFNQMLKILTPKKHLGIYGYHKKVLIDFSYNLKPAPIEEVEKLEQLRFLYNGYKIKLAKASMDTVGIDTKEDYEKFCSLVEKEVRR